MDVRDEENPNKAQHPKYPSSNDKLRCQHELKTVAERFFEVQVWLSRQLKSLSLHDPVHTIYDPLEYAAGMYYQFVHRYCQTPKAVLILGMNPGPWGMAQTGVPFGEVETVKNYLGLAEFGHLIYKPENEHPSRKVVGLQCHRKEPSGLKLWNLIKVLSNNCSAEVALSQLFLHNFCPLLFLKQSGCNLTPDELKASDCKRLLFDICSAALCYSVEVLECKHILCIGKFAEKQAVKAFNSRLHQVVVNY